MIEAAPATSGARNTTFLKPRSVAVVGASPTPSPVRVQFDLLPVSYIFKAGHRMRVSVAGADYRERDRETANPAPILTIYNSKEAPSEVLLPEVPSG